MELEKAIEILTIHNDHNLNFTDADRREARRLGTEALKREKEYRRDEECSSPWLLPGETEGDTG